MKAKLLLIATILALVMTAIVPSTVSAAPPTATQFTATVIPTDVQVIKEIPLGKSGRFLAEELITGFIPYSTWDLLNYAAVEIRAFTNYVQYPTGDREGVMLGKMVIHVVNGDKLVLAYSARISGPGGYTFDGHWLAVSGTGAFNKIKAHGTFFSDPAAGIPPTLSGTYR